MELTLSRNLKNTIAIIAAQVGHMTMGLVDTYVVGLTSTQELAGVAAGHGIYSPILITTFGFMLGIESLVSRFHGAGNYQKRDSVLAPALVLSLCLATTAVILISVLSGILPRLGIDRQIVATTQPYLNLLMWSLPLQLCFNVLQKYWNSRGKCLTITTFVILANFLNYYLDIYFVTKTSGGLGLGATGAGYATFLSSLFLLLFIVTLTGIQFHRERPRIFPEWQLFYQHLRKLLQIGIPTGTQVMLEVGAFGLSTFLMARLGATVVAAHHIILSLTSFTFMFPLGLSSATAIIVGQHHGQKDFVSARKRGWACIIAGGCLMTVAAATFILAPHFLFSQFTQDIAIIELCSTVVALVGTFQVFDGIQVVASGALRGLGNTRIPLLVNLGSHYFLGLPLTLILINQFHMDLKASWSGLAAGLIVAAILNSWYWHKLSQQSSRVREERDCK